MQDYESIKQYLLSKPESYLDFPFGEEASVFKVKNKMYALLAKHQGKLMLNLKCDPYNGAALRDIFSCIKEAYHMNKKHWISVYFENDMPDSQVQRLIDESFLLVVKKMVKKEQQSILLHL